MSTCTRMRCRSWLVSRRSTPRSTTIGMTRLIAQSIQNLFSRSPTAVPGYSPAYSEMETVTSSVLTTRSYMDLWYKKRAGDELLTSCLSTDPPGASDDRLSAYSRICVAFASSALAGSPVGSNSKMYKVKRWSRASNSFTRRRSVSRGRDPLPPLVSRWCTPVGRLAARTRLTGGRHLPAGCRSSHTGSRWLADAPSAASRHSAGSRPPACSSRTTAPAPWTPAGGAGRAHRSTHRVTSSPALPRRRASSRRCTASWLAGRKPRRGLAAEHSEGLSAWRRTLAQSSSEG
eukprot:scaffold1166_cov261-Pinguiococcus_pyrenoidosus.AAC.53